MAHRRTGRGAYSAGRVQGAPGVNAWTEDAPSESGPLDVHFFTACRTASASLAASLHLSVGILVCFTQFRAHLADLRTLGAKVCVVGRLADREIRADQTDLRTVK